MIATILLIVSAVSAGKLEFNSCSAKIRDINREIATGRSEWSIIKTPRGGSIYQKECGLRSNVYDMQFCTTVCEITEGETCKISPQAGDDVCAPGLFCGQESKCETIFEVDDFIEDLLELLDF